MQEQTIVFKKEKICKGSIRYKAETENPAFDGIYVSKMFLGDAPPETLKVTVSKEK